MAAGTAASKHAQLEATCCALATHPSTMHVPYGLCHEPVACLYKTNKI